MYGVMGITGKVGGAVAIKLLASGHAVRAVVRDAAKAQVWRSRGCDVAVANADDADALTRAFTGLEGVFLLLPPVFDPEPGFPESRAAIAAIRQALAHASPPKVVCLSTIGADASQPNLLNQLGLLEQALHSFAAPVTFLRAAWFVDNASFDIDSARGAGRIDSFLQPLDKAYPMVAARDVGVTAAELLLDRWQGHRVVELEGPRRVTPNDIARAFASALGSSVSVSAVPRNEWEARFRSQGMHNPTPRMQMLDGFNEGWIEFSDGGRHARHGGTTAEQVIASLVNSAPAPPQPPRAVSCL
jgi:NAD(P)H dehydrogenase (quinone)